ncbi:helicase/secretion neighborhood CpaE-like protein [Geodermatophilus aquaeductus]|uniref:Helicase/secretion neighborhood CpaE-like protein n=1 Tax=Geodermatophilus aquaeductus TaxID=1564161 RepID=A0A521CYI7_9ACTN|nr:helicase/secretion neighborhood CpaE-like protein [Geodermatophilus aquaeductus]
MGWARRVHPRPVSPPFRPLVVSADEDLLDDVLRVLAAAGTEAEVATGGPALRRAHREAGLVLLGADVLASPAVRALPRRSGVVVVAAGALPAPAWAAAVELGAERVAVLPDDEAWLAARAGEAVRSPVERGWLAVVGGACGGAGASTLATALAVATAARGDGVLLVDGDPWGGGLDLLLGAEDADGLRWPALSGVRGRLAGDALLAALPEAAGGVHVLAAARDDPAPVPAEALAAVVEAARGCGLPVVVDLPRGTGTDPAAEAVLAEADLAVLVVPARLRAASAARSLVAGGPWSAARVVVRSVPGGLSAAEVAAVTGSPVLAELVHDRGAPSRGERGEPPSVAPRSPLGTLTRLLLVELARPERAA